MELPSLEQQNDCQMVPRGKRGFAMGVRQAGIPIGGAIAGAVLPVLSVEIGWHTGVYVQSGCAILTGMVLVSDPDRSSVNLSHVFSP